MDAQHLINQKCSELGNERFMQFIQRSQSVPVSNAYITASFISILRCGLRNIKVIQDTQCQNSTVCKMRLPVLHHILCVLQWSCDI